jgi:hypothetical protein
MKLAHVVGFALSPLCVLLFGQSPSPRKQPQTFHVQGTISDQSGNTIPDIEITFRGGDRNETINANGVGAYESDLPLGLYTMEVSASGVVRYRRPLFRLNTPSNITFDAMLRLATLCGEQSSGPSGEPATDDTGNASPPQSCDQEDFVSLPSKDGAPLQLYVRYRNRTTDGDTHNYFGETMPTYDPVFAAYNLFSVEADSITYNARTSVLEARGNVVMEDKVKYESRKKYGDWMTFKIENGTVDRTGCLCSAVPRRDSRGQLLNPRHP